MSPARAGTGTGRSSCAWRAWGCGPGGQPEGGRRPARAPLARHDGDLRQARPDDAAGGRAPLAGGDPVTASLLPLVEDYLAARRGLGFALDSPAWLLRDFARHADRIG